jgi:hypothetical protein
MEHLEDRRLLTATIGANFIGSTNGVDSGFNPPDTDGVVGLNHFVELINGRFSVYNKSDGVRVQTSTLDAFWTAAGATTTTSFDPRVVFDHATNRWFAAAVDNARAAASSILLAVSDNADPTLGWTAFAVDADPGDNRWADFPQLGVDAIGVYFSVIMFDIAGVGADNATTQSLYSVPKADLLGAVPTTANLSAFRDQDPATVGFRAYPIVDFGPDDGRGPFIATVDVANDVLRRTNVTGAGAAGAVLGATAVIDVPDFAPPDDADQPGAKQDVDTGDSRFSGAIFEVGNSLWGAYAIDVGGRSAIRWHQIDESTNVVMQTGTISDPALEFFYPSIAANQFGDVVIGFSGVSTAQFISAMAVAGETTGGLTTFGAPLVLAAGTADFLNLDTAMPPRNRWGDYSATSLDPANPRSFWTTQEFVSATDVWSTQISQIVFIPPVGDALEPNNTLATATVLGSVPAVTLTDLTIHDANDEDFFKITAHSTGKLVVRALFDHDVGDLEMQILDSSGDVIASSTSSDDDEELVVPVVAQQMYFVRIFGFNDAINNYSLEVENFAAPAPTGVHLDPASDTGMMNNDGVTSDTTPQLFIQTDVLEFVDLNQNGVVDAPEIDVLTAAQAQAGNVPGIGVEVTLVNTTTGASIVGFANPLIAAIPEVYSFTPAAPLTAGTYLVTARLKVFDGRENPIDVPAPAMGRSTASPPLWFTVITGGANVAAMVSADMIAASDTGMFNTDNVTNKMSPAFNGIAPVGFKVRLYANGQLVGQTVAGSDTSDVGIGAIGGIGGAPNDGLGVWEITSEPLADAGYNITLEVEDPAGNVTVVNPVFNPAVPLVDIVIDTVEPNTPFLDLLDDTGRHNDDNITKDNTPQASMTTTDPNIALAQLLFTDNLKFRIFDRFQASAAEVLIYDSAQDAAADAVTTAGDMFTSLLQLTRTLPVLAPVSPAVVGGALANGVHNLKLEVEDRAGNFSHDFFLQITVDAILPPVSFGLPDAQSQSDGLAANFDSGVSTLPALFADRVTSISVPRLWGRAEANSVVRVFLDRNNNGIIDLLTDTFLGQTTAVPLDGNAANPEGYWEITSILDLNEIAGLPKDGIRRLMVTAEDVAGNPMAMNNQILAADLDELQLFIDTQGPQITNVTVNNLTTAQYDVFDPKPTTSGPTPLVTTLRIAVQDLPNRVDQAGTANDFLYEALVQQVAATPGNYVLVGDHVGIIPIQSIVVTNAAPAGGAPATAIVALNFFRPLPDDRYTLTVRDNLVDPVGNRLDGESNAAEPQENPLFPSGDGVAGGNFVARFTVDSRPEIAAYIPQQINVDINGNFVWDPSNAQIGNDATNVDLTFTMQVRNAAGVLPGGFGTHDLVFAGRFFVPIPGAAAPLNRFDQLAVYGNAQDLGAFRWLIDLNSDGVVNTAIGEILTIQPLLGNFNVAGALPVAGNFDGNAANGDEIGLYNAGTWALDSNRNFVIGAGDTFVSNGLLGHPIVGDFDGDGFDDLAVFNNNVFSFDLFAAGGGFNGADATLVWGFPGVLDRPVAADMDRDGIDDIGLWVPRSNAQNPEAAAEWYFLLSNDFAAPGVPAAHVAGTIARLNHPYTPVPFGFDLYAEFGNERALPLLGNFDPPVAQTAAEPTAVGGVADFDGDSDADGADFLTWQRNLGRTNVLTGLGDANGDHKVNSGDLAAWKAGFGAASPASNGVDGDLDGDRDVDGNDFLRWQRNLPTSAGVATWKANFGTQPAVAAASSVESAGSAALSAFALAPETLESGPTSAGEDLSEFSNLYIVTAQTSARAGAEHREAALDAAFEEPVTRSQPHVAVALYGREDGSALNRHRRRPLTRGGWGSDSEPGDGDSETLSVDEWDEAVLAAI